MPLSPGGTGLAASDRPRGWPVHGTQEQAPENQPAGELAVVTRSGFIESRHLGHAIVLDAADDEVVTVGAPDTPCYPRSSCKPLQAAAMLLAGAQLEDEHLAIAAASHRGHPDHLDLVAQVLTAHGMSPTDLQTPPSWPGEPWARDDAVRAGGQPTAIAHNCSGKHAGMLAACRAAGWDTTTYRNPTHPLQQLVRRVIEVATGVPADHVGVDGCGAALFTTTIRGLAKAFGCLGVATATPDGQVPVIRSPAGVDATAVRTALGRVGRAMRAHPWTIAGIGADDTIVMQELDGVVAKGGAEGVTALATATGHGVAVKVADGADRAAMVAALALLEHTGTATAEVADTIAPRTLGHGDPVGRVLPSPHLVARASGL